MGLAGLALLAAVVVQTAPASAVPTLQVYIEGASYDDEAEPGKSPTVNKPLRLWAVGNVDGPGGKGPIFDVKAAFAYSSGAGDVTIDIASATTTVSAASPTPPRRIPPPTPTEAARCAPTAKSWQNTGVYGNGTTWQEWSFGDFTETDSPIADFIDAFPKRHWKRLARLTLMTSASAA